MLGRTARWILRTCLFAALCAVSGSAVANVILGEPIVGGQLKVGSDGPVYAEFLGFNAGYRSSLYFLGTGDEQPTTDLSGTQKLFTNQGPEAAAPGDRAFLGNFRVDDLLWLALLVHNTGHVFFTGDASLNPDDIAHAIAVTYVDSGGIYYTDLGIEDLYSGGDNDFNDFRFRLRKV